MTGEEAAHRLADLMISLKRTFRSYVGCTEGCLSEERFRCLYRLAESPANGTGATLSALSERMRISSSSLCIMLGKLEEEGLVERERDLVDRRKVRYRISEPGRQKLREDRNQRLLMLSEKFSTLDEGEREKLIHAIEDLEGVLEKAGL
jgi:DNA-binding MarR family transcriptional regulator